MKKIFILFWMLCGITLNALAQEQLEISGTVTDATGETLIGVSVTVKDAKGLGTITNIDGKYTIKMQQYQTLVFSYLGYKPVSVLVMFPASSPCNLRVSRVKAHRAFGFAASQPSAPVPMR